MSQQRDSLVELLSTTKIKPGTYQGETINPGWGRVYGGHVLAQSLAAATKEVQAGRAIHSFHGYFVLPGDIDKPITYEVEPIRDGSSISTRCIKALQNDAVIFYMAASFQVNSQGFEHQDRIPDVPGPEELITLDSQAEAWYGQTLPKQEFIEAIDIRPVDPHFYSLTEIREPTAYLWMKVKSSLPDDFAIHEYLLAYASDMMFLPVSSFPHGADFSSRDFQMASIDHSMWFHRPFRFDDWLLYAVHSPTASNGRGFSVGRFFDRQGRLVASTTQEGVMRFRSQK